MAGVSESFPASALLLNESILSSLREVKNIPSRRQAGAADFVSRLTLVSLIFLPVTALTGFFGMNFNWLIASIASGEAFVILGVLLPLLSVVLTIAWLWHRDIIRFRL
jgi:Mg2+ and Co2+ transporter CorA